MPTLAGFELLASMAIAYVETLLYVIWRGAPAAMAAVVAVCQRTFGNEAKVFLTFLNVVIGMTAFFISASRLGEVSLFLYLAHIGFSVVGLYCTSIEVLQLSLGGLYAERFLPSDLFPPIWAATVVAVLASELLIDAVIHRRRNPPPLVAIEAEHVPEFVIVVPSSSSASETAASTDDDTASDQADVISNDVSLNEIIDSDDSIWICSSPNLPLFVANNVREVPEE